MKRLTSLWNSLTSKQDVREPPTTIGLTGGIAQERVFVGVNPQAPPESIRQGVDTPSRPGRMPIAILTGIDPQSVAEGRFVAGQVNMDMPLAQFPLARQNPQRDRVNIPVPPHTALGSYYESWDGMYG